MNDHTPASSDFQTQHDLLSAEIQEILTKYKGVHPNNIPDVDFIPLWDKINAQNSLFTLINDANRT